MLPLYIFFLQKCCNLDFYFFIPAAKILSKVTDTKQCQLRTDLGMWDRRLETEDMRQEIWKGDFRQEIWDRTWETGLLRQEMLDRRHETEELRQETIFVHYIGRRQKTWDFRKEMGDRRFDLRQMTGDRWLKIGEVRQEKWDRVNKTGDGRQEETCYRRLETGDRRHVTGDRKHETGDRRLETG